MDGLDVLNEAALRHKLRLLNALHDLALAAHVLRSRTDSDAPLPLPTTHLTCCEAVWAVGEPTPAQERWRAASSWGDQPSQTFASAIATLKALRHTAAAEEQLHVLLQAQEKVAAALGHTCAADDLVPALQYCWVRAEMHLRGGCSLGRLQWLEEWQQAAQEHPRQGHLEYAFCTALLVVQHLLHSDLPHQKLDRRGEEGARADAGTRTMWVTWAEDPPVYNATTVFFTGVNVGSGDQETQPSGSSV